MKRLEEFKFVTDKNIISREFIQMFMILWNVLGGILLFSSLYLTISLISKSKSEQAKLPFDGRK